MLINLLRRDGSTELKHIEFWSQLNGLRWTSLVIETSEEAAMLLTDKGQDWWKRIVVHQFVRPKE